MLAMGKLARGGKVLLPGEQERQGWSESKEGSQEEEGSRAENWGHERGQRGKNVAKNQEKASGAGHKAELGR